jgi:hypothetical protein
MPEEIEERGLEREGGTGAQGRSRELSGGRWNMIHEEESG